MSRGKPKVVLLVPFSSEEQSRIIIWKYVHNWLSKTLNYPLYIGEHFPDKPIKYNLSAARNQAAYKAGNWDVAVVHDADTVIGAKQIQAGVATAWETGAVTYPYTERWELDFNGTKMLLQDEASGWRQHMQKHTRNQPLGGCMVVRRDLWELVRGFDSGFVGWGHEDGAFAMACEVLSGKKSRRIIGRSLHLEHVFSPAKRADNPVYLKNRGRIDTYKNATRQPEAASLIRKLRDDSIKIDEANGVKWPKILKAKTKMNQAVALMLLVDVANVLEKYSCTYWLSDGTLLGAIRENNFIAHDEDIDLGVWAGDFDKRVIHELIGRFSCTINRLQGKPDDGMVLTVGRAGIHLDMFFYYPCKSPDPKHKGASKHSIYSSLYQMIKPYSTSNKAKRYDCLFPTHKPLVRREFLGHKFWVPKNAEKHLAVTYGSDWRKPKVKWDLFKDQQNFESRGIVKDMAADRQAIEQYFEIKSLER